MATELTPELRARLDNQLRAWQHALVSVDRRQKLIYFKHLRSGSLELVGHLPGSVLEIVSRGRATLLVDDPANRRQARDLPAADKTETEITAAARRMDLTSQAVFADRGFWTLYLGLGMLRWAEPASGEEVLSPLVLCPVEVKRDGTQAPYKVSRRDEEALVNPALKLHLERDFDVILPEVDGEAPDLERFFTGVRAAITRHPEWEIQQRTVLTTFSFHKEAIYRDLVDNTELIAEHPLVQALALGGDAPGTAALAFNAPADRDLDEKHPPERMLTILDADSSQRRCIVSAAAGHSFVMDGPPGTGKSQTIANIVAELIAAEKTVLFVSEKAAALDVVRNRLADKKLGDFLFELHSHAATRKEVVQQLNQSLTQRVTVRETFTDGQRRNLTAERRELTAFADAMNLVRQPLERSLFQAIGRLMELETSVNKPLTRPEEWADLTPTRLDEIVRTAESLANAWRPVSEGEDFLWRELAGVSHSAAEVRGASDAARTARTCATSLADALRTLESDLLRGWPVSLAGAQRWHALLVLGSQQTEAPDGWLVVPDLGHVLDLAATRRSEVDQIVSAESDTRNLLGEDARSVSIELGADVRLLGDGDRRLWAPGDSTLVSHLAAAHSLLARLPESLEAILTDAVQLAPMMGIAGSEVTAGRAAELAGLALLGESTALPERTWLNPAVRAALEQSQQVLAALVTVVRERHEAVAQVFTPEALNLDLAELDTRFRTAHTGFGHWSSTARADRKALKRVTVTRKANKAVRLMLSEAASWQKAERELSLAEQEHGPRLGSYYRRVDTDFDRVAAAVQVAQSAIRLAGEDINQGALADQIAVGGSPDPRLTVIAARLVAAIDDLTLNVEKVLGTESLENVLQTPIENAVEQARAASNSLTGPLRAVEHVAGVAGRDLTCGEARLGYAALVTLNVLETRLAAAHANDVAALGTTYDGVLTDWSNLESQLAWAGAVRAALGGAITPELARRLRSPYIGPTELLVRMEAWTEARDHLAGIFADTRGREIAADLDADLLGAPELLVDLEGAAVEDIAEWDAHASNIQALQEAGLTETIGHLMSSRAPSSAVAGVAEWAVLQAWVESTIVADSRLAKNRAVDRNSQVTRFREHDAELVSKAFADVVNACTALRPGNYASSGAQLIMREAQKKTRHLPIRELLEQTHEIVQSLKPCFMMSPLSVSQFLPAGMTFDVVIFDEASQVLPSDAVNCIYRSSQLIVAGDERQLPPTSFFASSISEGPDGDDEVDSFESVLKLCKSTMPSLPLTWHYRSQHESLITYSNYRFYAPDGQRLQSFPGATFTADDLGVESILVDGVYRRGTARDNPVEAEKVAERVAFHRQHHPDLSIGVVTFSTAQEDAIVAAIERRSLVDPSLTGLLDDHDRLEGFFVKNLENVQGDERDIIIFSIGYGPDEFGKLTMNFGPLNRDGGWRRLNVAITRARRRVEVVSSFEAGEMADSETEGVRHLKGYLDFAARGTNALGLDLTGSLGDVESPFEEDVLGVIRSWGYEVVPQVGSAGYRVDLGVRHPTRPGEYVLGVECDGAAYHSAATARDRDRLRAAVLEGLGWNLHRIWGLSWYRDRARQAALLKEAIESAFAGAPQPKLAEPQPDFTPEVLIEEIDPDAMPEWAEPYTSFDRTAQCPYDLHEPEARPYLERFLLPLFEHEAPIHKDLVNRRLRDAYGVGRIGHRIQANIDAVVSRIVVDGSALRADGSFYSTGTELTLVRLPAEQDAVRPVAQVPREELDLATFRLVQYAVTMQEAGVAPALSRLFGWGRSGADIQTAVVASIGRGLSEEWLERTRAGGLRAVTAGD